MESMLVSQTISKVHAFYLKVIYTSKFPKQLILKCILRGLKSQYQQSGDGLQYRCRQYQLLVQAVSAILAVAANFIGLLSSQYPQNIIRYYIYQNGQYLKPWYFLLQLIHLESSLHLNPLTQHFLACFNLQHSEPRNSSQCVYCQT